MRAWRWTGADALIATTDPEYCFRDSAEYAAWTRGPRRLQAGAPGAATPTLTPWSPPARSTWCVEAGLKAWDIDAAIPLIAGAGGVVTDWRGQPVGAYGGQVAIAGDRACPRRRRCACWKPAAD